MCLVEPAGRQAIKKKAQSIVLYRNVLLGSGPDRVCGRVPVLSRVSEALPSGGKPQRAVLGVHAACRKPQRAVSGARTRTL